MGKDRGRGKRGGGGKLYVENEDEMALRDAKLQHNEDERLKRRQEADSDDDEENAAAKEPVKPKAAKAPKKVTEEVDGEETASHPGKSKASAGEEGGVDEVYVSRREREATEAAQRKADYEKRHLALETEQARTDLARLALVRQRREEAKGKREVEGRAPGWNGPLSESDSDGSDSDEDDKKAVAKPAAAPTPASELAMKKKAAAAAVEDPVKDSSDLPKLKSMDIKKMNADAVKDHLKARNLSTQGQKKDLMQRLIDFEASRA